MSKAFRQSQDSPNDIPNEEREEMNRVLVGGIRFLMREKNMDHADIGRALGYGEKDPGSMSTKVVNEGVLFGLIQTRRFAVLCSNHGYDAVSDYFCGDEKDPLPRLETEIDFDTAPELLDIFKNGGMCRHFTADDLRKCDLSGLYDALRASEKLIVNGHSLRNDIQAAITLRETYGDSGPVMSEAIIKLNYKHA